MIKDDFERKPVTITDECLEMLSDAAKYLKEIALAPKQAEIMNDQFFKATKKLGRQPGLGTRYENGMRRIMLGKFRYFIYYREKEDEIEIVGIQHTSMGKKFSED